MPGRTRTTKKLAQRIDLNYFKQLYPIPRWRRILSIALTGLGLLWLGWEGLSGKQRAFSAGALARSHALLTQNCAACHAGPAAFGKKVTGEACLSCHDGPAHQAQQTFTPACTVCHVEHQGSFRLATTSDQSCTQCHASLKTKDGRANFAARITSFEAGHPDFRFSDPGTVKFNHQAHLEKKLKCVSCHTPAGAYMEPVDFQKHCASCHPLLFDKRFAEPVPHQRPDIVMAFAVRKFTEYIAAHLDEVHMADPADPRILRPALPPARNAAEWIARRVADTQQLLWRKSCRECHTVLAGSPLPAIPAAAIPAQWMKHASFDHEAHQMLGCVECHTRAATSREAADVLMPGIQTCRKCHHSGSQAVESGCSECHVYHDWRRQKQIDGRFTIDRLTAP